jgi:hypothetical protein
MNTIDIEKIAAMPANLMVAFVKTSTMKRHEVYELIDKLAQDRREPGQSSHSAFAKFITRDPLGMELYQINKLLPGSDIDASAIAKAREVEVRKDDDAAPDPLDTWNALLDGVRRANPRLNRSQAHDQALKDPQAQKIWQAVKQRDLAKSYRGLGTYSEAEISKIISA